MLAVVAAFLAAVVVFSALRNREAQMQKAIAQTVDIVVARNDVQLGQKLDAMDLRLARWSRDSMPRGAFTDPSAVTNSYARTVLLAGQPIVQNNIVRADQVSGVMPLIIPPGMRAMSVPVDEVADIAGFVKPHTRVDVLVSVSGSGAEPKAFSKIVLQNIEVLAVAQQIEKGKDDPEIAKVVTLLVSPHEAEKLGLASREGTLRLAMRNYTDNKLIATVGSDLPELFGVVGTMPTVAVNAQPSAAAALAGAPSGGGRPAFSIEIMRDGKNEEKISFVTSGRSKPSIDTGKPVSMISVDHKARRMSAAAPAMKMVPARSDAAVHLNPEPASDAAAFMPLPKTIELPAAYKGVE